jgi:hypothetical protein
MPPATIKTEPTIAHDAKYFPSCSGRVVILKFEDDSVTWSPTDNETDRPRPKPEDIFVLKAVLELQIVAEHTLRPKAENAVKSLNPKLMPNTETICEPVAAAFLDLIDEILM